MIKNEKDTHAGMVNRILSEYGSLAVVEKLDSGPTPSPILLLTVVNSASEDLSDSFSQFLSGGRDRRTDTRHSLSTGKTGKTGKTGGDWEDWREKNRARGEWKKH
jgi:hypothetical protein